MKKKVILAIAAVLSVVFAVANHNLKVEEARYNRDMAARMKVAQAWLADMKYVADRSGDKEAQEVYRFIKENYVVAAPQQNQADSERIDLTMDDTAAKRPNRVILVPMLPKDLILGGGMKVFYEEANDGYYNEELKVILLKGLPNSRLLGGILALHEGHHAMDDVKSPGRWQGKYYEQRLFEVPIYRMCGRIMLKLGGDRYRKILESEVADYADKIKKRGGKIGYTVIPVANFRKDLDEVYDRPSKDKHEEDSRQSQLYLHANFLLVERTLPKDKVDEVEGSMLVALMGYYKLP